MPGLFRRLIALSALAAATLAPAPPAAAAPAPTPPDGSEGLNSVLWMQKAAEYSYGTEQVFKAATKRLPALRKRGNALIEAETTAKPAQRAPAIILDLDETVLDNSPFQAAVVARDRYFQAANWDAWLERRAAGLVPGAKPFLVEAARRGFRIFYVSNRECPAATAPATYPHPACPARAATQDLLKTLGLPFADDPAALLLRNDQTGWQPKTARRQFIGRQHRVAMLVGDDLGDFLPEAEERAIHDAVGTTQLVTAVAADPAAPLARFSAHFGDDWFMLANPTYGSWERGLGSRPACGGNPTPEACYRAATARKRAQLVTTPSVTPPPPSRDLTIAAWNLEWLMLPAVYDELFARCTPGQPPSNVRAVPCPSGGRPPIPRHNDADFDGLARYAVRLDADVIGLAEVDGPETAARVFKDYSVDCFVARAHPQKVGFAIRKGLPYRCNPELAALDTDGASRAGADVTIFPDSPDAIRILAVHLKSGCPQDRLDTTAPNSPCPALRRQVPVLEAWVDARVGEGIDFAVVGDFNRRLELDAGFGAGPNEAAPTNVFQALSDNRPEGAVLLRATAGQPFIGCTAGGGFTSYIDNVLISRSLAERVTQRFVHQGYDAADAALTLSDHCPIGLKLGGAIR